MSKETELLYYNYMHIFSFSVLFIILASPCTFKRTQNIMDKTCGLTTADNEGKPYAFGLFLHSLFFFILALSIVYDNYILLVCAPIVYLIVSNKQ